MLQVGGPQDAADGPVWARAPGQRRSTSMVLSGDEQEASGAGGGAHQMLQLVKLCTNLLLLQAWSRAAQRTCRGLARLLAAMLWGLAAAPWRPGPEPWTRAACRAAPVTAAAARRGIRTLPLCMAGPLLNRVAIIGAEGQASGRAPCWQAPHLHIEHLAPHRPAQHVLQAVPVQVNRPEALHGRGHGSRPPRGWRASKRAEVGCRRQTRLAGGRGPASM